MLSETSVEVIALDMPVRFRRKPAAAPTSRPCTSNARGAMTGLAVVLPDVPGGVVSHSQKEVDRSGRVVRRSTLELVDYGVNPEKDRPGLQPQASRPPRQNDFAVGCRSSLIRSSVFVAEEQVELPEAKASARKTPRRSISPSRAQPPGLSHQIEELRPMPVGVFAQRRRGILFDRGQRGLAPMRRIAQHHAERRHRRGEPEIGRRLAERRAESFAANSNNRLSFRSGSL